MTDSKSADAVHDFENEQEFFEERAGILEFEADYARAEAERLAELTSRSPSTRRLLLRWPSAACPLGSSCPSSDEHAARRLPRDLPLAKETSREQGMIQP
jgi:hypothetical protein